MNRTALAVGTTARPADRQGNRVIPRICICVQRVHLRAVRRTMAEIPIPAAEEPAGLVGELNSQGRGS